MLIAIPQIAFAAWWNPFTWNISIFNKAPKAQVQQGPVWGATTTQNSNAKTSTTTKKETIKPVVVPAVSAREPKVDKQAIEIERLKKEVEELKKKDNQSKSQTLDFQPVVVETWEQQEVRDFAYADAKGWTSLISTNSLGEKRYYHKKGIQWVRDNSVVETSQPSVAPPTTEELSVFNKWCLEVPDACKDPKTRSAYETNLSFRNLTNALISRYNQAQQAKIAQKQQLECLMALTPEDERVLDPATQDYLRKLRCGTATSADKTNYELSKISSKISDLEYRLKNNQTVSPSLINEIPVQPPTNKWRVQWTSGGAGFITNSSGGTTYFQCDNLLDRCFSL